MSLLRNLCFLKKILKKLKYIGLSDTATSWIKSYLSNRITFVEIEGYKSSERYPLLFLIYINDMPQSVNCDLMLYADDSCTTVTHKEIKIIEDTLNKNLLSLCDWLVVNKLSIHLGKTESILFGTSNKLAKATPLKIMYGNQIIEQKLKVKYLGISLDNNLSGKNMFESILSKINSKLGKVSIQEVKIYK